MTVKRRKEDVEHLVVDQLGGRRVPLRAVVLIDQQCPNALAEVVRSDDPACERVLGAHFLLKAGAAGALDHQSKGYLARQRALAAERAELGLRPLTVVRFK